MTLKSISITLAALALAMSQATAQTKSFGTETGNPERSFSAGKTGGGQHQSARIRFEWNCEPLTKDGGLDTCDPYLVWCPIDGEDCVSTEN